MAVPSFYELFNPVLEALRQLGGSGSVSEIEDTVIEIIKLEQKDAEEMHRGNTTKLGYRLGWARNYLKRYGLLENSARGIWALTAKGRATASVDKDMVDKEVHKIPREADARKRKPSEEKNPPLEEDLWEEKLMDKLRTLSPEAFERLCQRILRESGFIKVEVVGKVGDGGIDGVGIVRLNGLLSFHIVFQCKRYAGSVSASQIRDFRGAMQGKAEKGLFITTGSFTRDARNEAARVGALQIDLIDGDELITKMRELGLGVKIKTKEIPEIDEDWFKSF
ncbi:MAG TPA: restriction endonuclease [Candidatus Paceibacterota bacterium]|nr:restriction endonuclease [Candidatus Paceibacterota bacterium]